jgi:hypothetical protein
MCEILSSQSRASEDSELLEYQAVPLGLQFLTFRQSNFWTSFPFKLTHQVSSNSGKSLAHRHQIIALKTLGTKNVIFNIFHSKS